MAGPGPASSDDEPSRDEVEQILVRGVRTGVLDRDATVFSDSIDLREMVAEQVRLEDVLGELPGVQIRRFGGPGDPSEISIRGSTSSQVVIRLDGVRIDTAQSGSVDLSTLPVALFERVDVRRGGGAIHVGSGAIGGVVDLEPRWPGVEPVTAARLSAGSFDTWDGSLFHSRSLAGTDFSLGYSGFKTDGDFEFQRPEFELGGVTIGFDPPSAKRVNNRSEQHSGVATFRRELESGDELRFLHLGSYVSRGTPGLGSGSGPLAGQRTRAHSRNVRSISQLVLESHDDRPIGGSARISYNFERNRFRDPIPLFEAGEPIDVETDNAALAVRLEMRGSVDFEPMVIRLDGGFEGRRESLESLDSSDRDDARRNVYGGWLRAEFEPMAFGLRVVPSVRVDATEGFGTRWLPAIGLVVDPLPWLRLRAHFERSFRSPTFDELFFPDQGFARGNPDLLPERALVVDGGFELLFAEVGPLDDLSVRMSGFLHDIEESIIWFPISPDTIQPQNTGKARQVGVELAVSAALGEWVRLGGNLTWLDAEFDSTGVDLPGRAPLEVSARIQLGDPDRYKLGLQVHYVGRLPVDEGGALRLAARTTLDLTSGLELRSFFERTRLLPEGFAAEAAGSVWLALRVRNLTDESVRDALFFPQPGRTLSVSLEATF